MTDGLINDKDITLAEAVRLSVTDSIFYSRYFFPKTARQDPPVFHRRVWDLLESHARYCGIEIFRDGGKTSLLRLFTSKRVAYAVSRTILYVGKSDPHAQRSVEWIARAVDFNQPWATAFNLSRGSKWNSGEIEIIHGTADVRIRVLAAGITGSIRGINIEDYRPDLIIFDDVCDEENTGTKEARQDMEDLIFGALKESLAPSSDMPLAKLIGLGTPLDPDDIMAQVKRDAAWEHETFSCFDEAGQSAWPSRWPTDVLLQEKAAAIARNKLDIWMREKECTFISRETADFDGSWLNRYEIPPEKFDAIVMSIDPVPPPSPAQIAKNLRDKDYEVLAVVGLYKDRYYLLEYCMNKGHTPEWTATKFFYLLEKYRPRKCIIESVNYQRTLKWILEKAMATRRQYVQIEDKKGANTPKPVIINDALHGVTSNRLLYVRNDHVDFIEQFSRYPKVSHDDVIEAVAVCVKALQSPEFSYGGQVSIGADELKPLKGWRHSP